MIEQGREEDSEKMTAGRRNSMASLMGWACNIGTQQSNGEESQHKLDFDTTINFIPQVI